ncbi:hypothetical protein HYY75_07330 [bacterium]|nr:hypothetical protein [bacterium]
MKPNKKSKKPLSGFGVTEIVLSVLIMAIIFPALFNLQIGSDKALVKAGEFMVAHAVLQNICGIYKIKPFDEITDAAFIFDESGNEVSSGKSAFQVRISVNTVVMPNNWAVYKKIFLEVEKPGTFFGTTLLKTVVLRVSWLREL